MENNKSSTTAFHLLIFVLILWNFTGVNSQQRGSNRYNNNYREQTGAFGNECTTRCSNRGADGKQYDYYFCYTAGTLPGQNWDYCSPQCGTDSSANYCQGACTQGMRYTYCYTDNAGNWGYCGIYDNNNCNSGRGRGNNNFGGRGRNQNRGRGGGYQQQQQRGRGNSRNNNNNYYNNNNRGGSRGGNRGGRDYNGWNRGGRERERGRGVRG